MVAQPDRSLRRKAILKALVLIALFACLAVPAVFVNTLLGYLPALFFVFVLLMSNLYGLLCTRFLEYDEMLDVSTCVRGSTTELLVRLNNRSMLFIPHVKLEFIMRSKHDEQGSVQDAFLALPPRGTEDSHLDVRFAHIGEHDVGLESITVYDPLSLFARRIPVGSFETVLVTPKMTRIDDVSLNDAERELNMEVLRASVADGTDYNTVRDYAPGDPMKHVHWKLSSKNQDLLTKVFERQSNPSLDIHIDFTNNDAFNTEQRLSIYDMMIETAIALSMLAFENGLDTRLLFLKDDAVEQFSLNYGFDLRALVRALPPLQNAADSRFDQMLLNQGVSLYAAANVAVCSANYGDAVIGAAEKVRMSGRNVLAFAFVPYGCDTGHERALKARLSVLDNADVFQSIVYGEAPDS